MTAEEARSNLEKLLQLYDDGMIDFSIIRESIKAAIEALQKQIPKNPVINGDRNEAWTKDSLICPVCNQYFGSVYNEGYCKKCGQKLIQKRIRVVTENDCDTDVR